MFTNHGWFPPNYSSDEKLRRARSKSTKFDLVAHWKRKIVTVKLFEIVAGKGHGGLPQNRTTKKPQLTVQL
jgi:hypothetical protein